MSVKNEELRSIIARFAESGWDLIDEPQELIEGRRTNEDLLATSPSRPRVGAVVVNLIRSIREQSNCYKWDMHSLNSSQATWVLPEK